MFSTCCLAAQFERSDGNFSSGNWTAELAIRGPDGSGSGTAMRVAAGGNPGAYREVHVERAPDTAGNDNSTRLFSFASQAVYNSCFIGPINTVDTSLDGIQFSGGSGGNIAPALQQDGVNYVAGGLTLMEQSWTQKTFLGLTQDSFFPVGSPGVHPDFSLSGGPITFGFVYTVSTPSEQPVMRTVGFDNWQLSVESAALEPFFINAGLNDAWFNPATAGQGVFFTVFADIGALFLAWFTYDTERPDQAVGANIGEPGHRWVTAFGEYSGDSAELDVELTTGGVFDAESPQPNQQAGYGTVTVVFHGCRCATLTYSFPTLDLMGEIPLQRISNDNVALCEAMNAELQAAQ